VATGEIASLSGAGDDPRYFQISVVFADGHHAAGQFGRGGDGGSDSGGGTETGSPNKLPLKMSARQRTILGFMAIVTTDMTRSDAVY